LVGFLLAFMAAVDEVTMVEPFSAGGDDAAQLDKTPATEAVVEHDETQGSTLLVDVVADGKEAPPLKQPSTEPASVKSSEEPTAPPTPKSAQVEDLNSVLKQLSANAETIKRGTLSSGLTERLDKVNDNATKLWAKTHQPAQTQRAARMLGFMNRAVNVREQRTARLQSEEEAKCENRKAGWKAARRASAVTGALATAGEEAQERRSWLSSVFSGRRRGNASLDKSNKYVKKNIGVQLEAVKRKLFTAVDKGEDSEAAGLSREIIGMEQELAVGPNAEQARENVPTAERKSALPLYMFASTASKVAPAAQ